MAKRVKSDKPILKPVPSWQHADEFVRRIGDLQSQIDKAESKSQERINKIKAELATKVKPLQDEIALCTRSLEVFAVKHDEDFGNAKSRKLDFGLIGWRKSTSIRIKKNTLELIKQVFGKAKAAIYIRVKESVDKEALAKLTDEELASVGARRKPKDVFFVETFDTKAAEHD